MDEDGFLYLAYDVFDTLNTTSFARIRRSQNTYSTDAWHLERQIELFSGSGAFRPRVAATGSFVSGTLKVAVAYHRLDIPDPQIIGNMEQNGDWTATVPTPFAGTGPYNISNVLAPGNSIEGPDIAYDAGDGLYVVWSDDRDAIFKIYGNASYDGGVTMNSANEVQIGVGVQGIYGKPSLATGNAPGDIAVAYAKNDGMYTNPYLLVNRATFFDSCDIPPSATGYWTNSSGISVDYSRWFSDPASYKMEMSKNRGTLLRDFGTEEMQGSVMLQFYDSMPVYPPGEDFYVALKNDNVRGVIRMLGVKNDIPGSYAYSTDGVTWQDTGVPRSVGWHQIQMLVNDSGITMSIEYSPGNTYTTPLDPLFTSFTGVELEGGGSGGTYNVDDIRVEAYPLSLEPPVIPAVSVTGLMLCLLGIGGALLRRRR